MDNSFKEIAVEVYMNNVKSKCKYMDEIQLEWLQLAFETGLNIGEYTDKDQLSQAIALGQLSL